MKKLFFTICLLALTITVLTACGDKTGDTDGVTRVKYDSETGKVSLTATLTSETYKKYKGETLYLMEIPAGQSVRDVATSVPAAQIKARGTMEHSLELKSGARTLLYSGFVLAYYNYAEGYTPIGEVRYVENPEALATSKQKYPTYASPKGLFVTSAAQAVKTGTKHTVIRVPVEKFIRAKGDEETLATIFCGNSYYINRAELAKLDHKVKTMSESGIEVLLQFTLDTDPYSLEEGVGKLASLYTRGGSVPEGESKHYALAVTDPDGFEKLASFFEYLAQRYTRPDGEYGFAGAFIIGDSANDLESANTDLERTLAETTERYADVFRIAYIALRSNYANGKIFVAVDSEWTLEATAEEDGPASDTAADTGDGTSSDTGTDAAPSAPMPVARRRRFGAKEFLSNFAAKIKLGGDISYSVCLTLLHDGDSNVNNDISHGGKTPSKINCGNLTAVNTFLNSAGLTFGDDRRELAVIASVPAQDEKKMAQSYADLYFACVGNGVSAFIYNGERDGETGNGDTGLMTAMSDGQSGERRKIYDVFCAIDRADGAETLKELSGSLGSRAEKYAEDKTLISHIESEGSGSEIKVKRGESTTLFAFDGTSVAGFYPAYSALSLEPREDDGGAIAAILSPLGPGDLVGVRSPEIDGERFARGKVIKISLNAALPTSNTSKLTLFLQGYGKSSPSCESTVTVQSGNRQTVWFDISEFADKIDEKDSVRMSVWYEADNTAPIRGEEPADTGYSLALYGIEIITKTPVSPLWWIIPLIVVLLVGLFFLFVRFSPAISESISNYRENTERERAEKQREMDAPAPGQGRPPQQGQPRPGRRGYGVPNPQSRPRPQNPNPYGRPPAQRPPQDSNRNGY